MAQFEYSSNAASFVQALKGIAPAFEQKVLDHRNALITVITEAVMALTPVWEGDTLVNWVWSVGAPTGELRTPVDNGPPGHTSQMALGDEPRRAANEEVVRRGLEAVIAEDHELSDLYLSNYSDGAVPIEFGLWPTPDHSRSKQGVLRSGALRLAIKRAISDFKYA